MGKMVPVKVTVMCERPWANSEFRKAHFAFSPMWTTPNCRLRRGLFHWYRTYVCTSIIYAYIYHIHAYPFLPLRWQRRSRLVYFVKLTVKIWRKSTRKSGKMHTAFVFDSLKCKSPKVVLGPQPISAFSLTRLHFATSPKSRTKFLGR